MDYIDIPGVDYFDKIEHVAPKPTTNFSDLYTSSAATPAIDFFDPTHLDLYLSAPTPLLKPLPPALSLVAPRRPVFGKV